MLAAIGWSFADLMPPQSNGVHHSNGHAAARPKPKQQQKKQIYPNLETIAETAARLRKGKHESTHVYLDAKGAPVFAVVRVRRPDGSKQIPQVHPEGGGWAFGGIGSNRPPYRLPELLAAPPDVPIQVHEGEQKADLAARLGFTASTSSQGARNAHLTDFSPFRGRVLHLFADNDVDGVYYTQEAAPRAYAAGVTCVWNVVLPGLPPKGDLVDFYRARKQAGLSDEQIADEVRDAIERAEQVPPPGSAQDGEAEQPGEQPGEPAPEQPQRRAVSLLDVFDGWQKHGALVHEPTGISALDEITGGGPVYGSRVYLIGAPDAGKTAMIIQIADVLMARGITVGILAVDEEPSDLAQRFLQRRDWTRHDCERRVPENIDAMRKQVGALPLHMYDGTWSIEAAAEDLAARAKERGTKAAFFIDSIQTAHSAIEDPTRSLYVAVTTRVQAVRLAADTHRMLVMATSEMSRAAYRSIDAGDRINDLAAAKESGAIEYSARILLSLRSVPKESELIELRVAKNKQGPIHRDDEPGIHLRIDRARQILTVDGTYVAATAASRDDLRAAASAQRAVQDAAVLAMVLIDEPGIGKRDAETELRKRAKCGTRRCDAAFSTLRHAIVEQPAPRNRLNLYLVGAKVPEEVVAEIPIDRRPGVLNSTPPSNESA